MEFGVGGGGGGRGGSHNRGDLNILKPFIRQDPSFFESVSEPAALRNPQKNAIPVLFGLSASLRRFGTLRKMRSPKNAVYLTPI